MPIDPNAIVPKNEQRTSKSSLCTFSLSDPLFTFDDIVLPEDTLIEIKDTCSLIKHSKTIFEDWNLGTVLKKLNRPQKLDKVIKKKLCKAAKKRFWSLLLCYSMSVFDRSKSIKLKLDTLVVIPVYEQEILIVLPWHLIITLPE